MLQYGASKYGQEDPFMLTLQASFSIFVHRDTDMARMQLQQVRMQLLLAYVRAGRQAGFSAEHEFLCSSVTWVDSQSSTQQVCHCSRQVLSTRHAHVVHKQN
jgi:hypothetical protein